jgi:hypothetical protein
MKRLLLFAGAAFGGVGLEEQEGSGGSCTGHDIDFL